MEEHEEELILTEEQVREMLKRKNLAFPTYDSALLAAQYLLGLEEYSEYTHFEVSPFYNRLGRAYYRIRFSKDHNNITILEDEILDSLKKIMDGSFKSFKKGMLN